MLHTPEQMPRGHGGLSAKRHDKGPLRGQR
jgi:hypothetical protein